MSHVDEDFLALGYLSILDTQGNILADAAACVGATISEVAPERREDIQRLDEDTERLLLRLVHINMLHLKVEIDPERGTTPSAQPDMRPTFGQLVKDRQHRT